MPSRKRISVAIAAAALALVASACGSSKSSSSTTAGGTATTKAAGAATTAAAGAATTVAGATTTAAGSALPAGIWNDGPCDTSKSQLKVGLITVFQTGVLTLVDQAQALEASAKAFNARGGVNGHCVQVTTCDDKADPNTAVQCVSKLKDAGVAVTVNDTTSFGPADVRDAMKAAGIPRFAISPGTDDFADLNSYPLDAGGSGTSIEMPQACIANGKTKVGTIRVDAPAAASLVPFEKSIFGTKAEFVSESPVPAGTTDYSQFIIAAQKAGATCISMPIGGQEAIQILRAAKQLNADLLFSTSLGTLPISDVQSLGDYGDRIILNAVVPPAGVNTPIMNLMTTDLGASGVTALQRDNMKVSPLRSWVGLYALEKLLRDQKVETFTAASVTTAIKAAKAIPMLGLMDDFTPDYTAAGGVWTRIGASAYSFWKFDHTQQYNGKAGGNFVKGPSNTFEKLICGSPVGAKAPCPA